MGREVISFPQKPNPEDLKEILEFHQQYDLQVDLKISEYKDDILRNTEDIKKEKKEQNKKSKANEQKL